MSYVELTHSGALFEMMFEGRSVCCAVPAIKCIATLVWRGIMTSNRHNPAAMLCGVNRIISRDFAPFPQKTAGR
jgi:hypothetical protein